MRFSGRANLALAVLVACGGLGLANLAGARGDDTAPAPTQQPSRGVRGALLNEAPGEIMLPDADTAPIDTAATLSAIVDYLKSVGATNMEGLSDDAVRSTMVVPDNAPAWRQHLAELAREESGRRGLSDDPFPSPAAPDKPAPRAAQQLSEADLEVLARIVKGECWPNTPTDGRVAVASVVLNRVGVRGYPDSVAGVAHQPYQFSSYNPGNRQRLYNGTIPSFAMDAARAAASGQDPTGGALSYFNPYLVKPSWAKTMHFVKRIGTSPLNTHDFYR
jgi:hypothetical protein